MFETDLAAKRIGRIVFGGVLIFGAFALGFRGRLGLSAAEVMIGSWLAAFGLGAMVGRIRFADPHPSLAKASHVIPAIGVALMAPLLIHLPFFCADSSVKYDEWVAISMIIVGPAHIAFALTAAIRASQLVDNKRALSPAVIIGIVVTVTCIPFAILILIPPILVALTSLPLIPVMLYQERLVIRERTVEPPNLPRAIAWAA